MNSPTQNGINHNGFDHRHLVGQQHAVQPAVDDAVPRAERHAPTVRDELGEGLVGNHVHGLRIGRGVAERLHHQIRLEPQAGQILELIPRHWSSGILRAHRPHAGLAVRSWHNTIHSAGPAHHLLRQRKALHVHFRLGHPQLPLETGEAVGMTETKCTPRRNTKTEKKPKGEKVASLFALRFEHLLEDGRGPQAQALPRPVGETAADDEGDAPPGAHLRIKTRD